MNKITVTPGMCVAASDAAMERGIILPASHAGEIIEAALSADPYHGVVEKGLLDLTKSIFDAPTMAAGYAILADWAWQCGHGVPKALMAAIAPANATGVEWMPIETAPKSLADGSNVRGVYLLGYCPDESAIDPSSCICVVWWKPNIDGGVWYGEGGYAVRPTHWMPLPPAPSSTRSKDV